MWDLPPLKALRAFEAAARHMSFTEAAEELSVTPSAISRQIRLLEEHFGLNLFERGHREVALTSESRQYAKILSGVFELIEDGSRQLGRAGANTSMTVSLPPTLLSWMVPRLATRPADRPDFTVNFSTAAYLGGHVSKHIFNDVNIQARRDEECGEGCVVDYLFRSYLTPVCTPQLAEHMFGNGDLRDLKKAALLRSKFRMFAWRTWLEAMGETAIDSYRYQEFPNSTLAFQAASCGIGVAIGDPALLADELESGVLVQPFGAVVDSGVSYYAIYTQESLERPSVRNFRRWILKECKPFQQQRATA